MLLDLIYPPVCGICNKINKKSLCKKCELILKKYEIYTIQKCKNRSFDYQIKILKYEETVRHKIIDYKFNEKSYLYKTFSKIILNNEKIYSFLKKYDIMVYVPMHTKKKLQRGYNQTELIAKEIAKKLGIKLQKNNLIKIKDTAKQSTLTKKQRIENVKGAFAIKDKDAIKNKKIILFDDIYTTGSTAEECCKVLKAAGASEITILTLAVDWELILRVCAHSYII